MKLMTPISWIGASAGLLFMAFMAKSPPFAIASVFAFGVGAGTLFPALKEHWTKEQLAPAKEPDRVGDLEKRLRLAEEEVASATRELAQLKAAHEFDAQLKLPK